MNRKFTIILLFFISATLIVNAQTQIDQSIFFQQKADRYHKMKKNGLTLSIVGASATVAGILFINQADWEKETTATGVNYNTNDASGGAGIIFLAVGAPLAITGIILGIIGSKKEKEYKGKINNLSWNVTSNNQITGIKIVYNFK